MGINDELVFLGGCTTGLFISDTAAPDVRATLDVDSIVDVITLGEYHKFESELTRIGFKRSMEDDIVCRWHYEDMILDVMPTNEKILGFGNRWYKPAIDNAITYHLSNDLIVKSVSAPYFLATKFEAFKTRGNNDYLTSHDLEDIITVVDGRVELIDEINSSDDMLKLYLTEKFSQLLNDTDFVTYLPGHLNYGPMTTERTKIVLNRIKALAKAH